MRYRMILFDFFNTLVVSDSSRLPTVEIEGKQVVSTAAAVQRTLAAKYPGFEVLRVHQAMRAASKKALKKRGPELKEPPALERFLDVARELGLDTEDGRTPKNLLSSHMEALSASFVFPAEHRGLLKRLRKNHRLGIFSNFDHAPTLRAILRRNEIETWFDPIVISETIGYRKPGAKAFREALALSGESRERILFVGDSLKEDVRGARRARVDVVWLNPEGAVAAAPRDRPTYTLAALPELEQLLENLPRAPR